jgi:hypothetical protein
MKTYKISIYTVLIVSALVLAGIVQAQALPGYVPTGQPLTISNVEQYIHRIAQFMIAISLIIAVIFIIWAGITYMSAGANSTKAADARKRLVSGLIGAAIVMAIGVILQTLSTVITGQFFN